jgi:hypothetical protein
LNHYCCDDMVGVAVAVAVAVALVTVDLSRCRCVVVKVRWDEQRKRGSWRRSTTRGDDNQKW